VKPESSVRFDPVAADAKRKEEMQQFLAAESSASTLRQIMAMMQVKELKAEDTTEKAYAAKANAIAALKVKIDAMKAAEKVELAMEAAAMVAADLADKADIAAAEAVKENAARHQQVQAAEAARVANHAEKAMLQAYEASSNVADKAKSAMEAAAKVAIEATENAKRAEEAEAKAEQSVENAMEEMVEMDELLADKFAGYMSKVYDKASAKVTTIVPCGGSKGTCSGDAFSFKEEHGLIRLECSGKDGCNSVDFKCTNPTLCSVTCKDGEPACNSLTVTPGITVICSSEEACNSVKPESSVRFDPVAADAKRTVKIPGQVNSKSGKVYAHMGEEQKSNMEGLIAFLHKHSSEHTMG